MKKEYSSGWNARVYRSKKGHLPLCGAEVVRETGGDQDFRAWYYKLMIASLFFPQNFIEVRSARLLSQKEYRYRRLDHPPYAGYSQLAQVHPDHAKFSLHMTEYKGSKSGFCNCRVCSRHRKFHLEHQLEERATSIRSEVSKAGISVHYNDPSDYCLETELRQIKIGKLALTTKRQSGDNLVFFEVDYIEPNILQEYLSMPGEDEENRQRALGLFKRYCKLFYPHLYPEN